MSTETPQDAAKQDMYRVIDEYHSMVASLLRIERERRGLDLATVAARCGRSKAWVSQIELGRNDSHKSAALLAQSLGIEFALIVAMAESAVALREQSRKKGTP